MSEPIRIDGEFNLFAKTPEVVADWKGDRLRPSLRLLVRVLAVRLAFIGVPCVLTELMRESNPNSVHYYGRGADCRITCSMEQAQLERHWFNKAFPYDTERPHLQTIPNLRHGSAPHFHLQVS